MFCEPYRVRAAEDFARLPRDLIACHNPQQAAFLLVWRGVHPARRIRGPDQPALVAVLLDQDSEHTVLAVETASRDGFDFHWHPATSLLETRVLLTCDLPFHWAKH